MRRAVGLIAGLVLAAAAADAGDNDIPLPELPEITVEAFLDRSHDPGLLTIELRADRSVDAATFGAAQRPLAIAPSGIRVNCLAVLIIDETSRTSEVVDAIDRFGGAGCEMRRLVGDAPAWIAAGLAGPAEPRQSLQPGDVPFIIPRGLCEPLDPVQTFN